MKEYDIIVDIQDAGLSHHEFKKLLMVFSPFIEKSISNQLLVACREPKLAVANNFQCLQVGAGLFGAMRVAALSDNQDKTKILDKSKGIEI